MLTGKLKVKLKRVGNFLGGMILSLACLFVGYLAFTNVTKSLDDLDVHEGEIIEKGITVVGSKIRNKVFYIKMEGLEQTLATFNPSRSYDKLDSALNVGDKVKAFFTYSQSVKPNIETYRIEKNREVILNESSFQRGELIAGIIAVIGGTVIMWLAIKQDKKYWK